MQRPSYKELFNKIKEAKKAVAEKRIILLNQNVIACDALELGYLIEEDLVNVLSELLNEILPENYVGKRPPQKSYEQDIKDLDLFAFKLDSTRFGCKVYLKFTLGGDDFWLVSLHRDRKE